jgi:hypothetical protein
VGDVGFYLVGGLAPPTCLGRRLQVQLELSVWVFDNAEIRGTRVSASGVSVQGTCNNLLEVINPEPDLYTHLQASSMRCAWLQ